MMTIQDIASPLRKYKINITEIFFNKMKNDYGYNLLKLSLQALLKSSTENF